jgi:hypothetical protein
MGTRMPPPGSDARNRATYGDIISYEEDGENRRYGAASLRGLNAPIAT